MGQIVEPNRARPVPPRSIEYLQRVLDDFAQGRGNLSGYYKNFYGGEWLHRFEEAFAEYVHTKHAIGVSSGTAALHTAITATLDWAGGDSVVTTPLSFVSTASSVLMSGNTVEFADVFSDYTMNPFSFSVEKAAPGAILPVHLLGNVCDMDLIRERFGNTPIIEDACQALGGLYKGRPVGSLSDISCFSFQETKTITTLGEGGMIATNNDVLAERCRAIRNHGEKYGPKVRTVCYNYRMTEPAAAFGLGQLEEIEEIMRNQRECARIVIDNLPGGFAYASSRSESSPSYYLIATNTDPHFPRHDWIKEAQKQLGMTNPQPGATIGPGYTELITHLPLFLDFHRYEMAENIIKTSVWFDVHRFVSPEIVRQRMDALKEIRI